MTFSFADPESVLEFYRAMLRLRRETPELRTGRSRFFDVAEPVLAFTRGGTVLCVFNLSPERHEVMLAGGGAVAARPGLRDVLKLFKLPAFNIVVGGYTAYTFALGAFAEARSKREQGREARVAPAGDPRSRDLLPREDGPVAREQGADALTISNTLPVRDARVSIGRGGLSGRALLDVTLACVRAVRGAMGPGMPEVPGRASNPA